MKALKYAALVLTLGSFAQCSDYLDVSSPGEMSDEFVTSSTDEAFKTLSWAYGSYRDVASGGNYNMQDVLGSDAEYLCEYKTTNNAVAVLDLAATGITTHNGQFTTLYSILARVDRVASVIAENPEYQADAAAGKLSMWTHLYGEAKTFWAQCYFILTKYWGDVPFDIENSVATEYTLTSRFEIRDAIIAELKAVEGLMYPVGKGGITAERLNRTYANALIGEIALHSGSWQTIRTDISGLYGSVTFETKGTDDGMCVYARRTNYKDYLAIAAEYLDKAINETPGTAALRTEDPRSGSDNPFQYIWSRMNSRVVTSESIWEVANIPGTGNAEQLYAQGRPGSNNNVNSLLNCFAAVRVIPSYFYTAYEDGDKRRDATMVVTGINAQTGAEVLVPFGPGTRIQGGGPSNNKWDHQKADVPNYPNALFRANGVNYMILRVADAMLMLAEAKAGLGNDDAGALALVNRIRARAFGDESHALSGLSGEALLDAVYAERKLELFAEGDIRWDMIRSGKFNERAVAVRAQMSEMAAGLKANGYYTFANGRTISESIWTKQVYLDGVGATGTTSDATDKTDPVRYPGWRGVWNWPAITAYQGKPRNLAIRGLYDRVSAEEAAALEADGYTKVDWGSTIVARYDNPGANNFDYNILSGVVGRENAAPRYFFPIPLTVITQSKGQVTNGYGLPNQ